jgi:hypothetical protein
MRRVKGFDKKDFKTKIETKSQSPYSQKVDDGRKSPYIMIDDKVNTGVTSGKNNPNHVNMDVYYAKLPDY